jgi:hypothetical protein
MRRYPCDPLAQRGEHLLQKALRQQLEADRAQLLPCQQGEHDMLATATPSVMICRVCRTLGVCLWCGLTPCRREPASSSVPSTWALYAGKPPGRRHEQ